jgi:hypothetical protein
MMLGDDGGPTVGAVRWQECCLSYGRSGSGVGQRQRRRWSEAATDHCHMPAGGALVRSIISAGAVLWYAYQFIGSD